jgi:hypothetical protein
MNHTSCSLRRYLVTCLEGLRKLTKNHGIADTPAEILTRHLLNNIPTRYHLVACLGSNPEITRIALVVLVSRYETASVV